MRDKTLSIIIPSYNMEKFLNECIASMAQSKYLDDIEIIIVNDGSTDKTSEIGHEWAKNFPDSVRVFDKENGGHGSAINYGVYSCAGKYFKVIDADDWVDTVAFDMLTEKLKATEADCVVCNYMQVYEASGIEEVYDCVSGFPTGKIIPIAEYAAKYNLRLHSVTFKTEVYRRANIKVREKCFFDDAQYCLYSYAAVENAECYPYTVYQYRLQRAGQSVSPQGFLKHLDDHQKVVLDLCEFGKRADIPENVKDSFLKTIGDHIQLQYSFISRYGSKEQLKSAKLFNEKVKSEYADVYKRMRVQRGGKLLKFLNFGHYGILGIFRKVFLKGEA